MAAYVYILASRMNGTLFVGVTNDLERRYWEHANDITPGFASKCGCKMLVWYDDFPTAPDAIAHEKRIKRWRRAWKIQMIEAMNPQWENLADNLG